MLEDIILGIFRAGHSSKASVIADANVLQTVVAGREVFKSNKF